MLTSLDQLEPGKPWPIDSTNRIRHDELLAYRNMFKGEPTDLINSYFDRISSVIGNFDDVISYDVKVNYPKKISIKTADLAIGELPTISTQDAKKQEQITDLVEKLDLWNVLYEGLLDVSRYGTCLVSLGKDEYSELTLDIIPALFWYPVVDPNNIKKIKNHVIAYTFDQGKKEYIKFEIHHKGLIETRIHELKSDSVFREKSNVIGKLVKKFEKYTGLLDFAVIPISNITSSDSIYGISDYEDISSIVAEIEVRLSQISKILDKHADPSIILPSSCVTTDPDTGETSVKTGNAFILDSSDTVEPKYLTWDGQLEANFKMLDTLFEQLGILSELGNLFLGNGFEKLGNISGVALRKLAFNALAKVNRLQMRLRPAIIKILKLASQLEIENIDNLMGESISVQFGDGLPTDRKDLIEELSQAVSNGIMSAERAIELLNEDATQEEIEKEVNLLKGAANNE